jgi:transcription elongation factor Elf1
MAEILEQGDLIELINSRFPDLTCPRCASKKFALMDDPSKGVRTGVRISGPSNIMPRGSVEIDTATVVCTNCGRIEQFALSYLSGQDT